MSRQAARRRNNDLITEVFALAIPRPEQVVLLALLSFAKTSRIYPAVTSVGWRAGYSERQTRAIIRSLRQRKILVRVEKAKGQRPNEYRCDLSAAPRKAGRPAETAPLEPSRRAASPAVSSTPRPAETAPNERYGHSTSPRTEADTATTHRSQVARPVAAATTRATVAAQRCTSGIATVGALPATKRVGTGKKKSATTLGATATIGSHRERALQMQHPPRTRAPLSLSAAFGFGRGLLKADPANFTNNVNRKNDGEDAA